MPGSKPYGAFILILSIQVGFFACQGRYDRRTADNTVLSQENLLDANKEMARIESEQIEDFIRRHQLDMKETGTGLRYRINRVGYGLAPDEGDLVRLNYTTSLLTGDTVYDSGSDGILRFRVGRGEVISGLEEGILLMREGDQAKFIIPSHLAYGLIGDQKKIAGKMSLIYDVTLLSVEKD